MGAVVPPFYMQVNLLLRHVSATHQGEIVYGINATDAGASASEIADFCAQTYIDTLGTQTDIGVAIGPAVVLVGSASPPYLSVEGSVNGGGSVDAETTPSSVAALMKKRSLAVAGRGGRGRNFLPWILRDSSVDDVGNIGAVPLGTIQGVCDDWLEAHAAGGGGVGPVPVVILHSVGGSTAADVPAPVDSVLVDNLIATQRRRLGR